MTPILVVAAGLLALLAGLLVARSFGQGGRLGRLIAGTRIVPIADAVELGRTGPVRYVQVAGRIDAEEPFEDAAHRPLVLRISLLETSSERGWIVVDRHREAVPFRVVSEGAELDIDVDALDEGLVVLPREAVGTAGEIPERLPAETPPGNPVRYTIRQVSAVEHAAVLGVPVAAADGRVRMAPGEGKPLILSTLERDEAMRMLGAGRRWRSGIAIALTGGGAIVAAIGLAWALLAAVTGQVVAASPAPSTGPGDPRSSGEGPGFVGEPLLAMAAVILIAAVTVGLTLAWIRISDRATPDRR